MYSLPLSLRNIFGSEVTGKVLVLETIHELWKIIHCGHHSERIHCLHWSTVLALHSPPINVNTPFHHILGSCHSASEIFLVLLADLVSLEVFLLPFLNFTLWDIFSCKEHQLKVSRDLGLACTRQVPLFEKRWSLSLVPVPFYLLWRNYKSIKIRLGNGRHSAPPSFNLINQSLIFRER